MAEIVLEVVHRLLLYFTKREKRVMTIKFAVLR
jgi:hypothetical protein